MPADEAVLRIKVEGGAEGAPAGGGGAGSRAAGGAADALAAAMARASAPFGLNAPMMESLATLRSSVDSLAARMATASVDPLAAMMSQAAYRPPEPPPPVHPVAAGMAAARAPDLVAEAMSRAAAVLDETLNTLQRELTDYNRQMLDLREALNPDVVRQRVAQELALAEARQRVGRALAAERERQAPSAIPVAYPFAEKAPPTFGRQLLGLAKSLRGSIGGLGGPIPGIGLDVAAAFGKGTAGAGAAGAGGGAGAAGAGGGAAAAGAGGGAAAGGLAALAGPAAAAAGVLLALKELKDGLVGATQAAGAFAAALISPDADPSRYTETLGRALTTVSDKLFFLSPVLSIFGSVLGAAIESVGGFMRALDGMVDRYAQYSPQLAFAQARAEMIQTLADVRRAQQVAPDLIRYLEQRTQMQQRFEEAKLRFLTELTPVAIQVMQVATQLLPLVQVAVTTVVTLPGAILDAMGPLGSILRLLMPRIGSLSGGDDMTLAGTPFEMPHLPSTNLEGPVGALPPEQGG